MTSLSMGNYNLRKGNCQWDNQKVNKKYQIMLEPGAGIAVSSSMRVKKGAQYVQCHSDKRV